MPALLNSSSILGPIPSTIFRSSFTGGGTTATGVIPATTAVVAATVLGSTATDILVLRQGSSSLSRNFILSCNSALYVSKLLTFLLNNHQSNNANNNKGINQNRNTSQGKLLKRHCKF